MHERALNNKVIEMLIREINTQDSKRDYLESKIPECYHWINLRSRNTFYEGVGAGTLKCITYLTIVDAETR